MSFKANNGRKIRFWRDLWVGDKTLEQAFPDLFRISSRKDDTISNCWNEEQQDWDLGFRGGLHDREVNSWLGLVNQLDAIALEMPKMGSGGI